MNKARRKELSILADSLNSIQDDLTDISSEIQVLENDEQEAYDNMPDGMKNGDRGDAAQEAINNMESASASTESAVGILQTILDLIEGVKEDTENASESLGDAAA